MYNNNQRIDTIEQKLSTQQGILCNLQGIPILLDASGVAYFPTHNLLIFSDLHFEKASFLTQFANPLPQLDTKDTLGRMEIAIEGYRPKTVVCLGDSLHDLNAINRMQKRDLTSLCRVVKSVERWIWVLGNHDPSIPDNLKGESFSHFILDNLLLVHEPEDLSDFTQCNAQIIGHFHPKGRIKLNSQNIKGKCFLKDDSHLFMPAFGSYTGGLDFNDPVLLDQLQPVHERFLLVQNSIFKI